jgi:hypothetical protein
MYGAVDPAAAGQAGICRIDNGIDLQPGDIALKKLDN